MKYLLPGTLNGIFNLPQSRPHDLTGLLVTDLAQRVKSYKDTCGSPSPDKQAVEFYLLNHLASIIRKNFTGDEVLPDLESQIAQLYRGSLVQQSERMFWYMLLITTRESRHLGVPGQSWKSKWIKDYGNTQWEFWQSIAGSSSEGAVNTFVNYAPSTTLGLYTRGVEAMFDEGKFTKGYGGKPWGEIARTLRRMVYGETSMEVMVDTAYTLAHNNGPMFNKGMMYDHYTGDFIKILDIQRSGQVPDAVLDDTLSCYVSSGLRVLVNQMRDKYPNEFKGFVDWFKVEADGSKHQYEAQKKKQMQKGQAKTAGIATTITIYPGFSVKVIDRKKAA